jgi:hypothetical protein
MIYQKAAFYARINQLININCSLSFADYMNDGQDNWR